MRINQEILEFAVELAESDLESKDLTEWQKGLEDFFSDGDIFAEPQLSEHEPLPESYTPEALRSLQKLSRAILNDIVTGRTARIHAPESFKIRELEFQVVPRRKGGRNRKTNSRIFAHGSTGDMFVYKLIHLLSREPTNKIRRCDAPAPGENETKCGRLFYRHRRQLFCSTRCTNRVVMRSLRAKDSYLKAERDAAHERYKARHSDRKVKRRRRK